MSVADRVTAPRHHPSPVRVPAAARVQTRQQQQVLDETCYPLGPDATRLIACWDRPYLRQFQNTIAAGSSQFMTGIGNELAHTGFHRSAGRRQCGSDVVEHPLSADSSCPTSVEGFASGSGTRPVADLAAIQR